MKWLRVLFEKRESVRRNAAMNDGRQAGSGSHAEREWIPAPGPATHSPAFGSASQPDQSTDWRSTSPAEFARLAAVGAAYCRIPLAQLPALADQLGKELVIRGVPGSEMTDLFNNSLLGVCPECRQYCAGGLILSLATLSAMGANRVTFMTPTPGGGPKQRLLGGQCGTPSCSNRSFYHLFWCPDLHLEMLQYLRAEFGIPIDPHTQMKRSHVWQPR